MKNKILPTLCLFSSCLLNPFTCTATPAPQASDHYSDIYPSIIQTIASTSVFSGDRHGQFEGDLLTTLSDGSTWKIHPDSRSTYESWQVGDHVRVKLRTEFYWFKREHKFELFNHDRGQTVKVMLIKHKTIPGPLKIISTETYAKSTRTIQETKEVLKVKEDGTTKKEYVIETKEEPCDFRKILSLNDGSTWVIKENLNQVQLGSRVYIGAQGVPGQFYDYVIITGDQREALSTRARHQ
ncbi:MAG: hypothetical protein P4L16_06250 [Chlamydiales bacterium]|nr:hypothetical protein [Chlamydiales bacterium]